jgi:hypothetical protein
MCIVLCPKTSLLLGLPALYKQQRKLAQREVGMQQTRQDKLKDIEQSIP